MSNSLRSRSLPTVVAVTFSAAFFASLTFAAIVAESSKTDLSEDISYSEIVVERPDGVTAGDVLIANVTFNGGTQVATVTPPSNWTLIQRTDNGIDTGVASYWKAAGGSEPSTYTWTIEKQTRAIGGITRYSGVDTTNPIEATSSAVDRGTTATAPSVTTTSSNARVVTIYGVNIGTNNSPVVSTSTGMTKQYYEKYIPFGPSTSLQDFTQAIAGATGVATATISNIPRDWVAQRIVLKPLSLARGTDLERSSNQFWSITDSSQTGLDFTGDFTLSVWYRPESQPDFDTQRTLIGKWTGDPGTTPGYDLLYSNVSGSVVLRTLVHDGTDPDIKNFSATLSNGTWYHLVFRFSASSKEHALWIDGVKSTQTGTKNPVASNKDFFIGGTPYDSNAANDGLFDDARVWSRALSDQEIEDLYEAPCSFSNGSGLQGWWQFTNNGNDSSGNGNNLTNNNSAIFSMDVPTSLSCQP
jgi:hypothetical protein